MKKTFFLCGVFIAPLIAMDHYELRQQMWTTAASTEHKEHYVQNAHQDAFIAQTLRALAAAQGTQQFVSLEQYATLKEINQIMYAKLVAHNARIADKKNITRAVTAK